VFAIVESQRRGFSANAENLQRQLQHTHKHLSRGRKGYEEGRGQGGGVDTAGYTLWTLEEGNWPQDDVTAAVVKWLLLKQNDEGYWSHSSNRPPSEASDFTTTYLALRALRAYGTPEDGDAIEEAAGNAANWLRTAQAVDTEDQVFQLLSLDYVDLPSEITQAAVDRLQRAQREDGGWAQKSDLASDAYATATVLTALREAGALDNQSSAWQRAIRFLLDQQLEDGSWLVKSRSKPFQTYFETGFPHDKDQFISTTATGWATIAILHSLPSSGSPIVEQAISTSSSE
jgi:N-acyl-D-amino-acid deacylase